MYKHVLILEFRRSGTSIFGELFNHFSTHTCYSEMDFDLYLNKDFSKPITSKIPRENIKIRLDYLFPWTYYWGEFPIIKFIGRSDTSQTPFAL